MDEAKPASVHAPLCSTQYDQVKKLVVDLYGGYHPDCVEQDNEMLSTEPKPKPFDLRDYSLFIFDLDGVIYRGAEPIPDAVETVPHLQGLGYPIYFLTNNSGKTREEYAQRLTSMGIPCRPEQFMTSAWATAHYLQAQRPGASVYLVGEPGLKQELEEAGLQIIAQLADPAPDYVVAGIDRSFSYERLATAQRAILNGSLFVATNTDATYPAEQGRVLPGAGTIVAAIQTATGKKPTVVGKPNAYMLDFILQETSARPSQTLLIGDRLDTDIALGKRMGLATALVLTGVTRPEDLLDLPLEMKPGFVFNTLQELR